MSNHNSEARHDFPEADVLINAFRAHYQHFVTDIHQAVESNTDSVVLARLGDDLDEYYNLVLEVSHSYMLRVYNDQIISVSECVCC